MYNYAHIYMTIIETRCGYDTKYTLILFVLIKALECWGRPEQDRDSWMSSWRWVTELDLGVMEMDQFWRECWRSLNGENEKSLDLASQRAGTWNMFSLAGIEGQGKWIRVTRTGSWEVEGHFSESLTVSNISSPRRRFCFDFWLQTDPVSHCASYI
jgi:hypothetical protein